MGIISAIGTLVKGKVLATTIVGSILVVGTGTALAATTTPAGQDVVNTITGHHATVTPTHQAHDGKGSPTAKDDENDGSKDCPGEPAAQQLATKFSLSDDSEGSSVQAICTLHNATFKGTVDNNDVTIDHALGYGEIEQLLTYAQSLAKKDNTTLTDDNVQMYIATALKNCGSTAIPVCVNTNVPADHSNNNNTNHDGGKPTASPTPHGDGKPTGTPTPHAN
jgi:hypothetical protein